MFAFSRRNSDLTGSLDERKHFCRANFQIVYIRCYLRFNWFKAVRDNNVKTSSINVPKGALADWEFTVNNSTFNNYAYYLTDHEGAEKIHLFEDHTDNKTDPYLMITVNTTNAPKKGTKRARAEA